MRKIFTFSVLMVLAISSASAFAGKRRQCIRAGGIWVITNKMKFCMNRAAPGSADNSRLFARRKCLRSGGIWMVSSGGKFCMKKLPMSVD